jgi:2-dehydro-3-deoxyphosphogluconate aldolase/(4S)-4-hydroxy-2-oxoglutarate aldolase
MSTTCFSRPTFKSRVVPVIVLKDAAHAVPLAHALLEGGIDVMEITLRSGVALQAIEAVARAVPQMHLGAGTVTRAAEVPQVMAAGATFAL